MVIVLGVVHISYCGVIHGCCLANENKTVGMGDAGSKYDMLGGKWAIPDEAVTRCGYVDRAKAGKVIIEGKVQDGTSAVSDNCVYVFGLVGKYGTKKRKDTPNSLAATVPASYACVRTEGDGASGSIMYD